MVDVGGIEGIVGQSQETSIKEKWDFLLTVGKTSKPQPDKPREMELLVDVGGLEGIVGQNQQIPAKE